MARAWNISDLRADAPLKENLRTIAQVRFQETFSYELSILEDADVEALHDMRVAARRLQAVFVIFQDCFAKKKLRRQRETIQRLIKSLGRVREADVFLEMLQAYRSTATTEESVALDLLIGQETHDRASARKELLRDLHRLRSIGYESVFEKFLQDSL
jgi:CHAD domain-containing protein